MARHDRRSIADAITGRERARREIAEAKWEKAKEDIPRHDEEFEAEQREGDRR